MLHHKWGEAPRSPHTNHGLGVSFPQRLMDAKDFFWEDSPCEQCLLSVQFSKGLLVVTEPCAQYVTDPGSLEELKNVPYFLEGTYLLLHMRFNHTWNGHKAARQSS